MKTASLVPALLLIATLAGHAATLDITVKDARGIPVEDAVAWVMPKAGPAPIRRRDAAIAQRDKAFVPLVTIFQTGTAVQFPNQDPIRHHVYSFSTPKTFEIKLYAGTPVAPIVFDKPGEVVLGCNIHDHMIAYVYVVDTPWFAKTGKDGLARIEGLPAGEHELTVMHYRQQAAPAPALLRLRGDESVSSSTTVALKPAPPVPPAK
ncbi:MAG TPA: methylamine utilization protein [Usitatibacter sp.]|nr:methylamine utilization protein [Usitatibacter sp.]